MIHEEKIDNIVKQVKLLAKSNNGQPIKLSKSSVSHFVPNPYSNKKLPKIDIKALNEIIEINKEKKICIAESAVTFSDLVQETLKFGLIPYTVPELKTITIGGAVSGCSVESMSYKLGGFHDSCISYELITGKGEIINCSREENSDIFHILHGSYGTLGIITKVSFKLLEAKPYVRMENKFFNNFEDFWSFLQDQCNKDNYDFIDGIIHSNNKFIVCLGTMVDKADFLSSYEWLNIYYKSTLTKKVDFLTTYEYFFRYDTECHWLTKTVPILESLPIRFLFGKIFLGSTNLIKWSERLKHVLKLKKRPDVVVDVFIPINNFEKFFKWYEKDFNFYPLWIVPYRAPEFYPWVSDEIVKKVKEPFFIDCAIYGKPNNESDIDYSEIIEKKTFELNGIKTLISRNHYDEETFWKIYSKERIKKAKEKLDPDNIFGDMCEKFLRKTV